MARVTGIGGFFFRARDPEGLNRWYGEHFGVIMLDSRDYEDPGWFQDRGETAGLGVEPHAEAYPNGRFAELEDPEGNRIQLWEPNAASVARDPGGR
jgi:glyoxylase I family protein